MADEALKRERISPNGKFSIAEMLKAGEPPPGRPPTIVASGELPEPFALGERTDPLPRPGDDYRPHARKNNKPEVTLTFVDKDGCYEGFSYSNYERVRLVPSDKPEKGLMLVVRFAGSRTIEVVVEGQQLHGIYNMIQDNVLPWIWERPGNPTFRRDDPSVGTVITGITIKEVEN
jgi:hypothetical protein